MITISGLSARIAGRLLIDNASISLPSGTVRDQVMPRSPCRIQPMSPSGRSWSAGMPFMAVMRPRSIGTRCRSATPPKPPTSESNSAVWSGWMSMKKNEGAVAVRTRSGEDLGTMSVADFAARLRSEQLAPA